MKTKREVEVTICDACQGEVDFGGDPCLRCERVYCYECTKVLMVKYAHSVTGSGSGDGVYCLPCDTFLHDNPQPLHTAYLRIENMRAAHRRMYKEWQIESDAVDAALKAIQDKTARG